MPLTTPSLRQNVHDATFTIQLTKHNVHENVQQH